MVNNRAEIDPVMSILFFCLLFMTFMAFFFYSPSQQAEKITGYDYCAPHKGEAKIFKLDLSKGVFDCANLDSFGDITGEAKIFKLDLSKGRILDVKSWA